jgi:hypothetical protein
LYPIYPDLPKKSGRPRYLDETDAYLSGEIPLMLLIVDKAVFFLNWIEDLEMLITCLDQRQHLSKQDLRVFVSKEVALAKRM